MELTGLIEACSRPSAYPGRVQGVEVHQTHISVVFLAGDHAYKIKKPVNLGFLDFSTLAKRQHSCEEEVRPNRRLAPSVYLGVVPVTRSVRRLHVEGLGEAIEWAVKMVRLPEEATLESRLAHGEVSRENVESLATRIASFHARADTSEHISSFGHFEIVARNTRENFEQSADQIGLAISTSVAKRLLALSEAHLARLRPLIEKRASGGMIRDTHGDLRLEHAYLFPERPPPDDLVIIDCIEFNERFRFADPVADMAFLVMDLSFHGRRDLARAFADAYFNASGDCDGRDLLGFYTGYRAAVRGKVEGIELLECEIPDVERAAALRRARAHWLLALSELEEPSRRPCLVLVGGLPGTGKSTLAAALAQQADFRVIRSDLVRKELAGLTAEKPDHSAWEEGIYTRKWTNCTYAECLRRAETSLFEGERVIVDATFVEDARREAFLELAARWAIPALFLVCRAKPGTVRDRLAKRRGDASDADWSVYLHADKRWQQPGPLTRDALCNVDTDQGQEASVARALDLLRDAGVQA